VRPFAAALWACSHTLSGSFIIRVLPLWPPKCSRPNDYDYDYYYHVILFISAAITWSSPLRLRLSLSAPIAIGLQRGGRTLAGAQEA